MQSATRTASPQKFADRSADDTVRGAGTRTGLAAERRHAGDGTCQKRADGALVTFTVYKVGRYPKNHFPTQPVYGNTTRPEVRLITCGGSFNGQSGHYRQNIVIFARMTGATGTAGSR